MGPLVCLLLTVAGCAGETPTQPSQSAPVLAIRAENEGAVVGVPVQLKATLETTTSVQDVPATWAVTGSAQALITSDGVFTATGAGTVTVVATYGVYRASRALQVVAAYGGKWQGNYRVNRCTRLTGSGSSYCRFIVNQDIPFEFILTQRGRTVSGPVTFFSTGGTPLLSGRLEGRLDDAGVLEMAGTVTSTPSSEQQETSKIEGLRPRPVAASSMEGEFVGTRSFVNAFGPQTSREEASFAVKRTSQ